MSTPAVTRPGRPRARFTLSRRWRRPVVAGLLIAVSLVLAPEQLAHGTGHLVAAGLMLAAFRRFETGKMAVAHGNG